MEHPLLFFAVFTDAVADLKDMLGTNGKTQMLTFTRDVILGDGHVNECERFLFDVIERHWDMDIKDFLTKRLNN